MNSTASQPDDRTPAQLRAEADAICRAEPGHGTGLYRGDPLEAVALQQEADRREARASDETARRIVTQDVCYCVSGLIYAAAQNWEAAVQLGFGEDDLIVLASRRADADDYRDMAPSSLQISPDGGTFKWKDGEDMWSAPFVTELEAFRDAFDTLGLDEPDGAEIYEHWLVSDWLASKLEERGESVVRDALGLTVWGRATTGQAIYMDAIIQDIARDIARPIGEA